MKSSLLAKQEFEISGKKEAHHKLIKKTLREVKKACSKKIAELSGLTQHQVSRRLLELELEGSIKNIGRELTKYHKTKVNIYEYAGS